MATAQLNCPKCNSKMIEGFIVDQGYGRRFVSQWVEGAPETGFWMGAKLSNKRKIDTKTYRCTSCGYLESYAK
jgi:DNA-directed RNA polymerase subunit RPC12/RpoP